MNKLKQFSLIAIVFFIFIKNNFAETFSNTFPSILTEEDCYNGIDDDGDGLIDLQDPDCLCSFVLDTANLISNPSFTNTEVDCAPGYTGCYDRFAMQDDCVEDWVSVNNSLILTEYSTKCHVQFFGTNFPSLDDFFPNDDAFVEIISTVNFPNSGSDYVGGTLISPLIAGEMYEFKVHLNPLMFAADLIQTDPTTVEHVINYSLYGHVSNNNFPYPDSYRTCPTDFAPNDYIELGSFELTTMGEKTWFEMTLQFEAPQNIERFVFGASCNQNEVSGEDFYSFSTFMDSFKLQLLLPDLDVMPLIVDISDDSDPCTNQTTLQTSAFVGATYQWYFNNEEIPNATESIFSFENDLANDGSYFVQVIDSTGSCGISDSLEILMQVPLEVVEEITNVDCYEGTNGVINLNISNPNGLSFLWTNEQGDFISNNQNLENVSFGNYLLEIITDDDCILNYEYEITQPEEIQLSIDVQSIACDDGELGQISINAIGGSPTYSYSVDGISFSSESNFELPTGSYEITVLDESLCEQNLSNVVVEAPEEFLLEIIPSAEIINLGESVQLQLASNRPLNDALIEWTPSEVLDCSDCLEVTGSIFENTNFQVSVTEDGCTAIADILIQVDKKREVFVPNVFSPNGDGYNDGFEIYEGIGVEAVLSFKVFNRWGALVFDDVTQGWDGDFKNQPMQDGVYVWMAEVQFLDGVVELYQGDVTLTR